MDRDENSGIAGMSHLIFLKNMERVNLVIQRATDLEQVMGDVLETVRLIFNCDRAWLIFPCDPGALSWKVSMESARPGYPGAPAVGKDFPMDPVSSEAFVTALKTEGPVSYDAKSGRALPEVAKRFSVQSQLLMAIYPKIGKPWMFGMHQCSYARVWSNEEQVLFREIGIRITDSLSNLLFLRYLRESEEKYRLIVQNVDQIIYIVEIKGDPFKGQLSFVSDKIESILGYHPDDFISNPELWFQSIHPDDIPYVLESTQEIVGAGKKVVRFYRLRHKISGEYRYLEDSVVPKIENSKVVGFFGAARDVTERLKTEEALLESEERYRALFEQAPYSILLVDGETNELVEFNDRAYENLGYTREEFKKIKIHDFEVFESEEEVQKHVNKIIKQGYDIFETKHRRKNGQIRDMLVSCRAISVGGRNLSQSILMDITERKRAEDELKNAKEEIERWNKELERRVKEKTEALMKSQAQLIQSEKLSAMGHLSAGLAHELNSPLAGLLPLIEKYRKQAEAGSEAYNELTLMLKASEHMAKVIRDFGSFARGGKGKFINLVLNDVIEDTLSFSSSQFKKEGIQIITEYADKLPAIRGDKTELQQVVLNMITNARDAMLAGGRFVIKTGVSKDKNRVLMEFIDNGAGIPKENIDRIFDPFFTTKKQGEGMGLGLSVSYGIIKKHGGEISVQSEPGKETKFTVILPVQKV